MWPPNNYVDCARTARFGVPNVITGSKMTKKKSPQNVDDDKGTDFSICSLKATRYIGMAILFGMDRIQDVYCLLCNINAAHAAGL